jgi:hypothetical protein
MNFRTSVKISGYKPESLDHRQVYAASLYEITSEHVSSICLLLLFSRLSSAAALLRSCIESAVRGTWLLLVATDEQVQDIVDQRGKDKGWPGLEQMIGAIEGHHKTGGLLRRIFTSTGSLNDFCHGGLMLIWHRMVAHLRQDLDPIVNRACLRNATNSLALITSAFYMKANDFEALAKIIVSGAELSSNFEMAGNGGE